MTVAELIEILTEFDPEFRVACEDEYLTPFIGAYQDPDTDTVIIW